MRRRSGFSLLETIIALGVAVVLLGSSVAGRRYLLGNIQATETNTIMSSLANDTIDKARLTRQQSGSFISKFTTATPAINEALYVMPYTTITGGGGTTPQLVWCSYLPSNALASLPDCLDIINPVYPPVMLQGKVLNSFFSLVGTDEKNAELVAVRLQPETTPGNPNVLDTASFTKAVNASRKANQIKPGTTAANDYSMYFRRATLFRRCAPATTTLAGISKRYAYYELRVEVWPYGSSESAGITRTATFADVASSPFIDASTTGCPS